MGMKAGNVFGLGVQLGVCAYFASVGDKTNAKKGLGYALNNVDALASQGISLNASELKQVQTNPTQSSIEALRGDYRNTLSNTGYLHVFDFAVGVGIAEGQASSPDSAAHTIARDSMANAANHEKPLVGFGYKLVPITGKHDVIEMLRKEWQETFSTSAIG